MEIKSPVKGTIYTLKSFKDGVFSEKMLGDGVAIQPKDNTIYAPIKGKLVTVFDTGHAYGIQAKDGTTLLIHIGLETVGLNGEGFDIKVKQNKKVKVGTPLVVVDFKKIEKKVPSIKVITIVTSDSKTKVSKLVEKGETTPKMTIIETK